MKIAFLHEILEEKIYMKQPDSFIKIGQENKVCLLQRSLYGLKQSPHRWYLRFDTLIQDHGFFRCEHDPCMYVKDVDTDNSLYLLLYMDDMLSANRSMKTVKGLKRALLDEFEIKDMGPALNILGMEICRNRSKIKLHLSQGEYLKKVLIRFGMNKAKHVETPLQGTSLCLRYKAPRQMRRGSTWIEFHMLVLLVV